MPGIDPTELAAFLHAAARAGTALTYAEALNALGFAFSRPKMRALCVALDDVDAAERGAGRPALACLVVRASDGLPGQGWWLSRRGLSLDTVVLDVPDMLAKLIIPTPLTATCSSTAVSAEAAPIDKASRHALETIIFTA